MAIFDRQLEVIIGNADTGIVIDGLKIAFDISRTTLSYPNSCELTVWGLSQYRRDQIADEFTKVTVRGGYLNDTGIIFSGELRNVFHQKQGPEIITKIFAGDSDAAFQSSVSNFSLGSALAKPSAIIGQAVKDMGLDPGVLEGIDDVAKNISQQIFSAPSKQILDQLAESNDAHWSIQDGHVDFVANDSFAEGYVNATIIKEETGMIGSPTITELGVQVTSLLNHNLLPHRLVQVDTTYAVNQLANLTVVKRPIDVGGGLFRINGVTHKGDNRDGSFVSIIEGQRVHSGKVI